MTKDDIDKKAKDMIKNNELFIDGNIQKILNIKIINQNLENYKWI